MTMSTECQLKADDPQDCGGRFGFKGLFKIDGLVLCENHTQEFIHQTVSSLSIHRKKFDKLLNRMRFAQ